MRRLYLVGESMPLRDNDGREPSPIEAVTIGKYGNRLLPFDPRHGVFPNFVMTPVLATIYALDRRGQDMRFLMNQLPWLLHDGPDGEPTRIFNVFREKSRKPDVSFEINEEEILRRWDAFEESQVWVLTGYHTTFGLLGWLLDKSRIRVRRQETAKFAANFLRACVGDRIGRKTPWTGHSGWLFWLCSQANAGDLTAYQSLRKGVDDCSGPECDAERVTAFLLRAVPTLHNDAYRNGRTGYNQACFVCHATGRPAPETIYWKLIGDEIASRLIGVTGAPRAPARAE
jgi:hypothetical protein